MRIFGRFSKLTAYLVLILFLASFLRLWQLGKYPVGFTPDEASFGYDAYSILKTGKDQWGHFLPVVLESFGDFKSPLYTYLTIPFVAVLGLTETATRLPNALIGIGAVYMLFLLVGEIGKLANLDLKKNQILQVSSALLLAVSSWHVMMSRGAFEANLTTFFLTGGVYFFLKGLRKPSLMIWASVLFGLNLFTYHSAKLLTPVMVITLIMIFRKKLSENWRKIALPAVLFVGFLSLMLYSQSIGGSSRISERSITQGALEEGARAKISAIQNGENPLFAKLTHNKYQVTAQRFFSNYSQYFSVNFLFTKGPAETTYGMIPGVGVLYPFEGLFLVGLIPLLLLLKGSRKAVLYVFIWFLLAPVPAALATGVGYSANRAESMIPALQILSAFGLLGINEFLKRLNRNLLLVISFLIAAFVAANLIKVWKVYFIDSPNIAAAGMLYGRGGAIKYASTKEVNHEKIIVSRTLSEPQIYVAFYNTFDPDLYQAASGDWKRYREEGLSFLDQLGQYNLGIYEFKNIDYKIDSKVPAALLIGKPDDFPKDIVPTKEINFPDGKSDIFIVDSVKLE